MGQDLVDVKKKPLTVIISALLITLFLYAAVSKLLDQEKFQIELGKSPLLTAFAPVVTWTIPVLEIIVSASLLLRNFRLIGLYAAFSLLALFTAYLIAILQFSFFIPCTCGGVLQGLSWRTHIAFNLFFLTLAATGVLLHSGNRPKLFAQSKLVLLQQDHQQGKPKT